LPFLDLHYLYALARAGDPEEADAFLASLRRHAEASTDPYREFWRDTGLPCAEAVRAFAGEDYAAAAEGFSKALPRLERAGGSHAQRHLFVEAYERAATIARGAANAH
jgi:hypothetical protein